MFHKKLIALALLLFSLGAASCSGNGSTPTAETEAPLTKITLPMGYIPNVQFAPFYVALERGYFEEAGIDLSFDYSFETDGVTLVGANQTPFALVSGEQALMARAQGLPVVYVAAWYQKFPISIVSRAERNIIAPQDLRGKKIGLPGLFGANYVGLRALLFAAGLQESDVQLDSIGFSQVEAFAAGQQDVIVGYAANEPVLLESKGYLVREIRVADYVNLASNGIITNESTLQNNPALVRAFVGAFLRGLRDTINDTSLGFEASKNYVENLKEADPIVQKQILGTSVEMWRAPRLGYSDPAAWENMQKILLEMKIYTEALDLSLAFSNDYLPEE
jgi:NitT/TauT family transport system substrate-binding protein